MHLIEHLALGRHLRASWDDLREEGVSDYEIERISEAHCVWYATTRAIGWPVSAEALRRVGMEMYTWSDALLHDFAAGRIDYLRARRASAMMRAVMLN